jgi:hypothetical protein
MCSNFRGRRSAHARTHTHTHTYTHTHIHTHTLTSAHIPCHHRTQKLRWVSGPASAQFYTNERDPRSCRQNNDKQRAEHWSRWLLAFASGMRQTNSHTGSYAGTERRLTGKHTSRPQRLWPCFVLFVFCRSNDHFVDLEKFPHVSLLLDGQTCGLLEPQVLRIRPPSGTDAIEVISFGRWRHCRQSCST